MIEELKLLLPLLQQAGEGAFWLAVAFIAKELLVELMVAGVALALAWLAARTLLKLHGPKKPELSRIDAAYEAVREAWLYGNSTSDVGVKLHKVYQELKALRGDRDA